MSVKLLSTTWYDTMHIVIESSYIPTCFAGDHHHLQGRQYQTPPPKKKPLLEGVYILMRSPIYFAASFATGLVYVTIPTWILAADLQTGKLKSEHIRYIRSNNSKSVHAMHVLNNGHEQGPVNSTMDLLQPCAKGTTPRLDSWENYCI